MAKQDAAGLVDTARYPLLDLDAEPAATVIADAHRQLRKTGACELAGFVADHGLGALVAEAERLAPLAHHSSGRATAYLSPPPPDVGPGNPKAWTGRFGVGAVAYDLFPDDSLIRALYEWDPLLRFVERILGIGPIYRYGDPFGALNLAVMEDGEELQWHFDQTDFVVSLALQDATEGGDFEVAPRIRRPGDERYGDVAMVLDGDRRRVVTLPLTPGTLLVFAGRHSLHRVTPVKGGSRLVALLAYDTKPGTVGTPELQMSRYGRTADGAT